jgi:hypothetical protein
LDDWDEQEEVGKEFKVVDLRTRWWSCDRTHRSPRGRRSLLIAIWVTELIENGNVP